MKFSVKFASHVTALLLTVQFAEAQQPASDYSSVVNANTRLALKIGNSSGGLIVSGEIPSH